MRETSFKKFPSRKVAMQKKYLFIFFLACLFILPGPGLAGGKGSRTIGEAFDGEELTYDIGFWLFDRVAVGELRIERSETGEYVASLTAYTTGMVDRILQHRKDIYVSLLQSVDGGKRFMSKAFIKTVDINGKVRQGITELDYEKGLMTWSSWGGGKADRTGTESFPPGTYIDDPLAAFYNFRFGVYGPVEDGREYRILTFPKKGRIPEIYARLATSDEMTKRVLPEKAHARYLADAKIDKELFGSGSGWVEILFDKELVPVEAVAKDIAFFGDVRGRLAGQVPGAGARGAGVGGTTSR